MEAYKCRLRPWQQSDISSLVRYANNPRVAANLTDQFPHLYREADGIAFIGRALESDPLKILAIDLDGETIGSIGIFPQCDVHRLNAEMGYWLGEPFWGRGIVTDAVRMVVDYAFCNFAIERIFARPFGINQASQRVLEKKQLFARSPF